MTHKTMSVLDIHSGDLLAWSENPYSAMSDLFIKFIRAVTKAEYGHVGVAWRAHDGHEDELFVIEATIPKIIISRATEDRYFYCIPMGCEWGSRNKAFLMSKIGLPYSLRDAARAFFGMTTKRDDNWQCAELAHAFYEESGILLPKQFKPSEVVKNAVELRKTEVYRVLI